MSSTTTTICDSCGTSTSSNIRNGWIDVNVNGHAENGEYVYVKKDLCPKCAPNAMASFRENFKRHP